MTTAGTTIRIFLPSGTSDGLRVVTRSGWSGTGLSFPRTQWKEVKSRSEFSNPGIYLLIGPASTDPAINQIYIGETESFAARGTQHIAERDFWTHAAFFTSTDQGINKAHIRYLEWKLIERLKESRRGESANGNAGQRPSLSESDRAEAEAFLAEILRLLPLMDIREFETVPTAGTDSVILKIDWRDVHAKGFVTDEGFVVLTGSTARVDETNSLSTSIRSLRAKLQGDGIVILNEDSSAFEFTVDWLFSSPSQAADVCLGRSASGPLEWKSDAGRTLGELQTADAGS